jgi:hypothetical protein
MDFPHLIEAARASDVWLPTKDLVYFSLVKKLWPEIY